MPSLRYEIKFLVFGDGFIRSAFFTPYYIKLVFYHQKPVVFRHPVCTAGRAGFYLPRVYRNGKVFIPSGHDRIECGDAVVVMTKHGGFGDIDDILV